MANESANKHDKPFLTDVKTLRERARQHIREGAVTESYAGNTETACKILNEALATELVKSEFLQHAAEEQAHADRIAERIVQLGGSPNFSPEGLLSRSHSEYVEGETLVNMITEDLVAERVAIDSYREISAYFRDFDSTTRKIIEEIQAVEEEHADDLAELLGNLPESAKI